MAILDDLKAKLGKRSISKISKEDLRREKIRLDQLQNRYNNETDKIEQEKRNLFQKGISESSDRRRLQVARDIKTKDAEAGQYDRLLRTVSHQKRVINGLLMIKEETELIRDSKSSILAKLPIGELAVYVEKATVEGELSSERVRDIVQEVEGRLEARTGIPMGEEEDVARIAEMMKAARESGETAEAQMAKVNEELKKTREPGEPE